jgi:hypothetical protein
MSAASNYAAAYAASQAAIGAPVPAVGSTARAEITTLGNLRIVSNQGAIIEVPQPEALAFATWINLNFG